jgi:hypothetical protein
MNIGELRFYFPPVLFCNTDLALAINQVECRIVTTYESKKESNHDKCSDRME